LMVSVGCAMAEMVPVRNSKKNNQGLLLNILLQRKAKFRFFYKSLSKKYITVYRCAYFNPGEILFGRLQRL